MGHQLTPIPIDKNKFEDLPTIDDKVLFFNNMQGMQRLEHKRKISKQERRLDNEAQDFELLLFSDTTVFPPSPPPSPVSPPRNIKRYKSTRLNHSPITIPGTPSPDYSHRDTNYKPPPLSERLLIDDLAFPTPKDTHPRKHSRLTANDFDFTSNGFPNELYRVGGVQMVREYEGRKQDKNQTNEDEDSKRSLQIYEKAYACYKPEFGESNAESAERHELIAAKVI
jgi:hypothetical protein